MRRLLAAAAAAAIITSCSSSSDAAPECQDGARTCQGTSLYDCGIDRRWHLAQTCTAVCSDSLGCIACSPGTGTCTGESWHVCKQDGSGYEDLACDPVQGLACNAATGVCEGACSPRGLGSSNIGCEYFPTAVNSAAYATTTFGVAVVNTSAIAADVRIEGGALASPTMFTVAPYSVAVQDVPWVAALKPCQGDACGPSTVQGALVTGGAYRLRSTQPVAVFQHNPLDFRTGTQTSWSTDSTVLLPVNALTGNYVVAAWQPWLASSEWWPSQMAITGLRDATAVQITTTASTGAGGGAPAFTSGVPQTVTLGTGDVLELFAFAGDLTGSIVTSDKPVQVIGGHYCAQVPVGTTYCDHLEEVMFPYEALSTKYLVTAPASPGFGSGRAYLVRVIATEPDTALAYDPPVSGAPATISTAGGFVEISASTTPDFQIAANHKVLVSTYMRGGGSSGTDGDPSMALAVPTDQYRDAYRFHALPGYPSNFVNVVAPVGAAVVLDGEALSGYTPIGATGMGVLRKQLGDGPASDGNHTITGDVPFGISVYGYGSSVSYWYAGGLDLRAIAAP